MVRALASHQCSPSSNGSLSYVSRVCCWFSPCCEGFSLGSLVFLSPQKPPSPNSNSTRIVAYTLNTVIFYSFYYSFQHTSKRSAKSDSQRNKLGLNTSQTAICLIQFSPVTEKFIITITIHAKYKLSYLGKVDQLLRGHFVRSFADFGLPKLAPENNKSFLQLLEFLLQYKDQLIKSTVTQDIKISQAEG